MTSPITHEKIIEVLRPLAEIAEDHRSIVNDTTVVVLLHKLRAARDLYQRLQAEKEGGDAATPSLASCVPKAVQIVGDRRVSSLLDFKWHKTQEGGDAAVPGPGSRDPSRPHVAPPASANTGTGRAIADEIVSQHMKRVGALWFRSVAEDTSYLALADRIDEALSSEHQRGLAEGERIGIEKSAKVADSYGKSPNARRHAGDAILDIADQIRALTGDPQT